MTMQVRDLINRAEVLFCLDFNSLSRINELVSTCARPRQEGDDRPPPVPG
ncbi:MAG: hypothetical protein WKG07_02980 [Hymenobacter sp.]